MEGPTNGELNLKNWHLDELMDGRTDGRIKNYNLLFVWVKIRENSEKKQEGGETRICYKKKDSLCLFISKNFDGEKKNKVQNLESYDSSISAWKESLHTDKHTHQRERDREREREKAREREKERERI